MTLFPPKATDIVTFRAAAPDGIWQVTRDGVLTSEYRDRGAATRAARLAACEVELNGGLAEVLVPPSGSVMRTDWCEGPADLLPPYSLLAERPH